jgi:hypothetical protein
MITCPKCGHENSDSAMNCSRCRINLQWAVENIREEVQSREVEAAAGQAPARIATRPPLGCVLALGVLVLLGIVPLMSLDSASGTSISEVLGPMLPVLGVGLGLVMAVGLANWKTWALWLVILLGGLGGIAWVGLTFVWLQFLSHYLGFLVIIPVVVGPGMIGVAAWFYAHRRDFH